MIDTYLASRRLLIGHRWREYGEPVPEAHLWRLNEGLVRAGQLREVELPEADFAEIVAKFCPAEAEHIFTMLGLTALQVPVLNNDHVHHMKTIVSSPPTLIVEQESAAQDVPKKRGRPRKILTQPPALIDADTEDQE